MAAPAATQPQSTAARSPFGPNGTWRPIRSPGSVRDSGENARSAFTSEAGRITVRRGWAVLVSLALVGAFTASPAWGVESSGGIARGAVGEWYLEQDGVSVGVRIQVLDGVEHERQAGGSVHTQGVNVQVIEATEDPQTGEPIFRQLVSDPYFAPATVDVHALTSASVSGSVSLSGQEWVGDQEPRAIGPYRVEIAADWLVSGSVERATSIEWDTEWGVKTLEHDALRTVPAEAGAVLQGDLPFGDLGVVTAELVVAHTTNHSVGEVNPELLSRALASAASTVGTTEHVTEATASWELGGDFAGGLNLNLSQPHGRNDAAEPAAAALELYGGYCDSDSDEAVSVYLVSEATPIEGWPQRALNSASLTQTFELWGEESRAEGCAEPAADSTTSAVGPLTVSLSVQWSADGPITQWRMIDAVHGADYATRHVFQQRSRHAVATGGISGWLNLELGASSNAILADTRIRSSARGEPPA